MMFRVLLGGSLLFQVLVDLSSKNDRGLYQARVRAVVGGRPLTFYSLVGLENESFYRSVPRIISLALEALKTWRQRNHRKNDLKKKKNEAPDNLGHIVAGLKFRDRFESQIAALAKNYECIHPAIN